MSTISILLFFCFRKNNTTQEKRIIWKVAKVRDLRNFYETVTKKCNEKSDDKVPFLSSTPAFLYTCKGIHKSTLKNFQLRI